MAYRDDHDAALRRAEALGREVDELRRENEALEEERAELEAERKRQEEEEAAAKAAALEPHRALEKLARNKRPESATRPASPRPARREKSPRETLVSQALSHGWWIGPVCVLPMLGGSVFLTALLGTEGVALWTVLGLLLGFLIAIPTLTVCQRLQEASQRRWLARLPFALPNYLGYLGDEHPADTVMTVSVDVDVPDAGGRTIVADAVAGAMRSARAEFASDVLVIRSPVIWARFARSRHGSRHRPGNHLLHAWFGKLVRRALLPIARAHPIRSVTVS